MKNSHQKTIDQSCAWLMQAFFVLLARHPYEAITITQIADQAQLSRRTFYRHFTAKDELLQKYLKMLLDRYAQLLLQKKITRHEDTLQLFFTFWQDYADELQLLQTRGLFERVLQAVNQWYPTIYRQLKVPWNCQGTSQEILYASAFGASGYFNILALWLQRGCPETPQEMALIVQKILQSLGQQTVSAANLI